jgi:hypothetical protein
MAANLVSERVEAGQHNGVRRVLARWMRYDVIALDEVGSVPLAESSAGREILRKYGQNKNSSATG